MKLLRLKASNIFSLGDVELDLNNRGLVLVTGYSYDEGGFNGSGKSSLTSKAILWTLYGKTVSAIKANDVVNTHGTLRNGAYGYVAFEDRAGNLVEVTRSRVPTVALVLSINKKDFTSKVMAGTQQSIDNLVGYSFEEFTRTSFFGQGLTEVFLDSTPAFQKQLIEKILPFETIDELLEKIKTVEDEYALKQTEANKTLNFITYSRNTHQVELNDLIHKRSLEEAEQSRAQVSLMSLPGPDDIRGLDLCIALSNTSLKTMKAEFEELRKQEPDQTICESCKQIIVKNVMNEENKKTISEAISNTEFEIKQFELKKKFLEMHKINTDHWDSLIQDKRNKIEEQNLKLPKLRAEVEGYSDKRTQLKWWMSVINKDVRMSLLESACPILNENVNYFLQKLKNPQINVEFKCNKGNFEHNVVSKTGGNGFHTLSGGEQQMVNFAVGLSLGALTAFVRGDKFRPSVLILDEPFTMLDNRNAEAMIEFLTTSNIAETILLVSNDPALMSLIPNVIKITKRNGISNLEN